MVLPPLSEHERGLGLGLVVGGGGGAYDDGGATVSAQGVLQDAGHLAVSVRDVGLRTRTHPHTRTRTHTHILMYTLHIHYLFRQEIVLPIDFAFSVTNVCCCTNVLWKGSMGTHFNEM